MVRHLDDCPPEKEALHGARSFGRNDDGSVNGQEAAVLREMWPKIVGGDSVYKWIEALNAREVRTSRGNPWSNPGMIYLLRNPRLAGCRYSGRDLVPVRGLEPIVSVEEHQQMCAVLDERAGTRKPRTDNPRTRTYLLSGGLVKCSSCGSPLHAKRAQSGSRGYSCIKNAPHFGCGTIRIKAQALEDQAAIEVLGRVAQPHVMDKLHAAVATSEITGRALAESIQETYGELRNLGVMYARKDIGPTAFKAAQAEYEDQLQRLRAEVKHVEKLRLVDGVPGMTGGAKWSAKHRADLLAKWWNEDSTLQERHELVAVFFDEIQILPSKRVGFHGFDSDRVVWVPRFA